MGGCALTGARPRGGRGAGVCSTRSLKLNARFGPSWVPAVLGRAPRRPLRPRCHIHPAPLIWDPVGPCVVTSCPSPAAASRPRGGKSLRQTTLSSRRQGPGCSGRSRGKAQALPPTLFRALNLASVPLGSSLACVLTWEADPSSLCVPSDRAWGSPSVRLPPPGRQAFRPHSLQRWVRQRFSTIDPEGGQGPSGQSHFLL